MKKWNKPEITELDFKCTEHGTSQTKYVDEIRTDPNNSEIDWFSFSSTTD